MPNKKLHFKAIFTYRSITKCSSSVIGAYSRVFTEIWYTGIQAYLRGLCPGATRGFTAFPLENKIKEGYLAAAVKLNDVQCIHCSGNGLCLVQ